MRPDDRRPLLHFFMSALCPRSPVIFSKADESPRPLVSQCRFEAASESKVKNAKQIVLYALGFLCFSQRLSGKIFNFVHLCVFPCFLDVGVIKSMSAAFRFSVI
jgi:hypothetical protein